MRVDDCIFCKIANGDIPSATVYEDDHFRAIMDIAPAKKGHVIILAKQHFANIFEIDKETGERLTPVVSKIAKAMKEALGCDGVNVLQNNGEAAWQSVFHLHVHIIPRYADDSLTFPWPHEEYAEGEAAEYAAKIAARLQ